MNPPVRPPLCGLVLAGGAGSRMGGDKASLRHPDGRTLARRGLELLGEAGCGEVFLSLHHGQSPPVDVPPVTPILKDPPDESHGPLSGILAAMRARPGADWLVIACDLPLLDLRTLETLVHKRRSHSGPIAYRSESDGRPEPLCTLYPATRRAALENLLQQGNFRLRDLLDSPDCLLLDPPCDRTLANANTPADWLRAIRSISTPPSPMSDPSHTGDTSPSEWRAELVAIYLSTGHDFRGRHEKGRLDHGATRVDEVECVAGMGLRGDRYFGYKPGYKGQVTFMDAAVIDRLRREFNLPDLSAGVFRRNLVVRGEDLSQWLGKRFLFQGVEFEGSEECKPCYWMDHAAAPGAEEFLKPDFGGGLRARILSDGVLRVDG